MSILKDAVTTMRTVLLLEERILAQSAKIEQLANRLFDVERRLATTEGRMEGFFAGAAAFSGGNPRSQPVHPSPLPLENAPTAPRLPPAE
jgi:hypothetical protein